MWFRFTFMPAPTMDPAVFVSSIDLDLPNFEKTAFMFFLFCSLRSRSLVCDPVDILKEVPQASTFSSGNNSNLIFQNRR